MGVAGGRVTLGVMVAVAGVERGAQAVKNMEIAKMVCLVRIPRLYMHLIDSIYEDKYQISHLDTERMFVYIYSTNERIMLAMPELAGGTYDDGSKKQRAQ